MGRCLGAFVVTYPFVLLSLSAGVVRWRQYHSRGDDCEGGLGEEVLRCISQ